MRSLLRRAFRRPSFALAVSCTLAVAVGATTLVFSVANGVLLKPLPFHEPDDLVAVVNSSRERPGDGLSPLDFLDWRERLRTFHGLAASQAPESVILIGRPQSRGLVAASVTANWFEVLGIPIALGRGFAPDEDHATARHAVVVLSDALWRDQFAADPRVLGRRILLDDQSYVVIGVASPGFATLPEKVDLWRLFVITPAMRLADARGSRYLQVVIGRLRAGSSIEQAAVDVAAVADHLREQYPDAETGLRYGVRPLRDEIMSTARPALLVLLGAVGAILLIACANVANLILVRTSARSVEIAIRVALGADPTHVAAAIVGEAVLYGLLGGAAGLALAAVGLRILVSAHIGGLPRLDEVRVDLHVVVFAVTVAVLSGALAALGPALRAAGARAVGAATSAMRSATTQHGLRRLGGALIIAELAVVVPLLVGAGLLGRSLAQLLTVDPGFRADHVVRFDITVPDTTAVRLRGFTDDIMRRLEEMPQVHAAAAGFGVPFSGEKTMSGFRIVGHAPDPRDRPSLADLQVVTPDYFAALGIPLLHGRVFTADDVAGNRGVALVNHAFASTYFGGEDPVGHTLTGISIHGLAPAGDKEIVGVVGNTRTGALSTPPTAAIYLPYDQAPTAYMTVVIRGDGDPETILRSAQQVVNARDPDVPISHAMTLEDAVRTSVARPRLQASLVGIFAAIALFLSIVGVYGLVAYTVGVRRQEIGIRIALGARPDQVLAVVLRQGIQLGAAGLLIGLPAAIVVSRLVRSLLYGVGPVDAPIYAVVAATLLVACLVASWIPARRAAATDAVIAMRPA